MAKIHLICGFMGFGKTTLAKKLSAELPAVRFTNDEFMQKLYSRNLADAEFRIAYQKIDDLIWELAAQVLATETDVILDYGFWSKNDRKEAYKRAKKLTDEIIFHQLNCDINIAKERVLNRTIQDENALSIDENCFNLFLSRYQSIENNEGYLVINH